MEDAIHNYYRKLDQKFSEAERLAGLPASGRDLYRRLSVLRWRLARDSGVPAFQILGNAALISLCERPPANVESLASVRGFGHVRMRAYGAEFMAVMEAARSVDAPAIGISGSKCDT